MSLVSGLSNIEKAEKLDFSRFSYRRFRGDLILMYEVIWNNSDPMYLLFYPHLIRTTHMTEQVSLQVRNEQKTRGVQIFRKGHQYLEPITWRSSVWIFNWFIQKMTRHSQNSLQEDKNGIWYWGVKTGDWVWTWPSTRIIIQRMSSQIIKILDLNDHLVHRRHINQPVTNGTGNFNFDSDYV